MNDAIKLKEYIEDGFGVSTKPQKYSTNKDYHIIIISGNNTPNEGLTSYCTFGLSKYEFEGEKGIMPFRVELLTCSIEETKNYEYTLANAASYFIDNKICLRPGSFIKNGALSPGFNNLKFPHLYLTLPMYWRKDFKGVTLSEYEVRFLYVFPISDSELDYLLKYGSDKFENVLERTEADILNIGRNEAV